MANAPNSDITGVVRTDQNWIGGNDYNPCGTDFVPPPQEYVDPLLHDLCEAIAGDSFPPLVQAAMVHAQFETIHPFDDGNGRTGVRSSTWCCAAGASQPLMFPPSASSWPQTETATSEVLLDSDLVKSGRGSNSSPLRRHAPRSWRMTTSRL